MDAYQNIDEYMSMYSFIWNKECFTAALNADDGKGVTMINLQDSHKELNGPNGNEIAKMLASRIGLDEVNKIRSTTYHRGDRDFYSVDCLRKSRLRVQCIEGVPVRIIRYEEGSEALQQEASGEGG